MCLSTDTLHFQPIRNGFITIPCGAGDPGRKAAFHHCLITPATASSPPNINMNGIHQTLVTRGRLQVPSSPSNYSLLLESSMSSRHASSLLQRRLHRAKLSRHRAILRRCFTSCCSHSHCPPRGYSCYRAAHRTHSRAPDDRLPRQSHQSRPSSALA